LIPEEVRVAVREHPYPLLFATVSGAHLYGFESADSDWDIRGAHILPAKNVLGLLPLEETVERSRNETVELDIVSHDVRKFFNLLLRPNGYVLEQLYSPIVIHATPEFEELKLIAEGCITRHHVHHYLGFADNQLRLFQKEEPHRIKPLLYVFRVLLTGIHLMRSGKIEANLRRLNESYPLPFLLDLIQRKSSGTENQIIDTTEMAFYEDQFRALRDQLILSSDETPLPDAPTAKTALNDLLVRTRLKTV
jgi:uncharacterized protein